MINVPKAEGIAPVVVKSPQPASSRRGLGTENGSGDEGRGEDALLKNKSRNRSKSKVYIVNF
jgi:hypothetical protein